MGTRSLTFIYEDKTPLVCFYRQFDGYIEGYGKDLATFLAGIKLVNGFGGDNKAGTHANGAGCLAAQIVAHFKTEAGIGGIYIQPFNEKQDSGQEYEYRVYIEDGAVRLNVRDCYGGGHLLCDGPPADLLTLIAKKATKEETDE